MQTVGDGRGGLSRRGFLGMSGAAAISAAASALLASCSSGGGASNHGPVDLLVWYWGEQEAPGMKNFMQKAVAKYNSSQSKVRVQAVLQSSDSLYSAFAAAAQAGKGPDIQYLWGGTQALGDVWLGYCAPLSDYVDASWLKDNIPQAALAQTNWGGKQWGMPFYQIGTAFPYNKKMFADAGAKRERTADDMGRLPHRAVEAEEDRRLADRRRVQGPVPRRVARQLLRPAELQHGR